jgi:hypothetical protein
MKTVQEIVGSANITHIGYDDEANELRVTFGSGTTFKYEGVLPEMHSALMSAESRGSFFARNIKLGFPASKVDGQFEIEISE